jgi:hypothetical protein
LGNFSGAKFFAVGARIELGVTEHQLRCLQAPAEESTYCAADMEPVLLTFAFNIVDKGAPSDGVDYF